MGEQPLTGWGDWLRALTLWEKGTTTLVNASLEESAAHNKHTVSVGAGGLHWACRQQNCKHQGRYGLLQLSGDALA